jgi:hypothetical protein
MVLRFVYWHSKDANEVATAANKFCSLKGIGIDSKNKIFSVYGPRMNANLEYEIGISVDVGSAATSKQDVGDNINIMTETEREEIERLQQKAKEQEVTVAST